MEQIISRDGTVISFRRSGRGRPLLFVHGATADHMSWARVSPQFEPHFTVYAIDRRGRGESGDAADYGFMREVEDVVAVVETAAAECGETVFLFGHSYGGLCSLEATLLTDKVGRLVLYEPDVPTGDPWFPPEVLDEMEALIDRGELEAAMEVFVRKIVEMPEHEVEAYRQMPLWKARLPLAATIPRELAIYQTYRFDRARFATLQVPTMLMLGGDSPLLARQAIELLHSALPNSQVVILPGEQHIAHHTNPELFVREMLRFLLDDTIF